VKVFTSAFDDDWRLAYARKSLRNFGKTVHGLNITIHVGGNSLHVWGGILFVSVKNHLPRNKGVLFFA
jgi:hypothetical protein